MLTDAPSLTELIAINEASSGAITLTDGSFELNGSYSNVKIALQGVRGFSGDITINDDDLSGFSGISKINEIHQLTSGDITAAITATSTQLKSLTTGAADPITILPSTSANSAADVDTTTRWRCGYSVRFTVSANKSSSPCLLSAASSKLKCRKTTMRGRLCVAPKRPLCR